MAARLEQRGEAGLEQTTGSACSPRMVAAYLIELRGPLGAATRSREQWVHRLGVLMEDARHGSAAAITQRAGALGREHGAAFKLARQQVARLNAPRTCVGVHQALERWLEKLVETCDLLVAVARDGDVRRLRETQALFGQGRRHARAFNEEYARLVASLREAVDAARVGRADAARARQPAHPPRRPRSVTAWPPTRRSRLSGSAA
jgi:hypothetical protein